jgi:hypothetical protein
MSRLPLYTAAAGGAAWLALDRRLSVTGLMGSIHGLLLLAILVLSPLLLSLAATPDRAGRHPLAYRAAVALHPLAAASATVSFFVPSGTRAAPRVERTAARLLLIVSAASLALAMAFAVTYGAGEFTGASFVTIPTMARLHGSINALGFVLPATLAWMLVRPPALARPPGTPFSRLQSRGRVGPDFFQRVGVVPSLPRAPRGLVDDFADYRRGDFDPGAVHPAVRAFYEETALHALLVRPDWRPGFRLGARLYKLVSSRVGQMNLPLTAEGSGDAIDSAILPIDSAADGRRNVRAWVRTYSRSGQAVYVAAYANHSLGAQTYMNIAFPLPGGSVTSVLRIAALGDAPGTGGVLLTTLAASPRLGDEGVYFANRLVPIRLPIDETIRVWAVGARRGARSETIPPSPMSRSSPGTTCGSSGSSSSPSTTASSRCRRGGAARAGGAPPSPGTDQSTTTNLRTALVAVPSAASRSGSRFPGCRCTYIMCRQVASSRW